MVFGEVLCGIVLVWYGGGFVLKMFGICFVLWS